MLYWGVGGGVPPLLVIFVTAVVIGVFLLSPGCVGSGRGGGGGRGRGPRRNLSFVQGLRARTRAGVKLLLCSV